MRRTATSAQLLKNDGMYTCPICRQGQISIIPLMDTFGCNLCGRMFLADLHQQALTVADGSPALTWYWNGQHWQGLPPQSVRVGWEAQGLGVAIVVFPTLIVALSTYIFPPEPGSALSWFPYCWIGLTFLSHAGLVLYLIGEYYQFPLRDYLRGIQRNLAGRFH
jgi:hypothetical protein